MSSAIKGKSEGENKPGIENNPGALDKEEEEEKRDDLDEGEEEIER